MKSVTIIVPSYCPDDTVKGYETRCLQAVADHTPRELYDLVVVGGRDWSFPQKVNAAARAAKTEYICVLSNDVFVGPRWLETLLEVHQATVSCGVLAPQEGFKQAYLTYNDHWWALVLIKRHLFVNLMMGLDESLPKVYADQDFSIRMRLQGWYTCRTGSVIVEHVGMATRSRIGEGDSAEERAEMLRRYGCAELVDWVNRQPDMPTYDYLTRGGR